MDEYLSILEKLRHYNLQEFTGDPERYGSAERFLLISIEAINDIARQVIADNELGTVNNSSDIPALFEENGYMSGEQTKKWLGLIEFKDRIENDDHDIDHVEVHAFLQNSLSDLRQMQRIVTMFI